ncbi:hypothetical protein [Youngiibacter multivorans]|uniref:Uncharacterized protein n=1 Tax=Youngiibacter multivorans TaxID=937251 RepID=A0ABS4G1C2_9CLOT|nr:hypothetical protein [Youngiibacter multivorans]MBP1918306.1 hypothetical protein [Youngiibacter multivorans]
MNPGQKMFYDFFIERALEDKKDEARGLLEESFVRQAAGTFNMAYLQEIMPKFFSVVKPEAIDEVKEAMNHFASRL